MTNCGLLVRRMDVQGDAGGRARDLHLLASDHGGEESSVDRLDILLHIRHRIRGVGRAVVVDPGTR